MTSRLVVTPYGSGSVYSLDGKRVPGVTTVLGVLAKDGLKYAAANETAAWALTHRDDIEAMGDTAWLKTASRVFQEVWNASATRGSQVHAIAERLVWGEPVPDEDPDGLPWPDDVRRMGEQVARFMDTWDVDPILVERPVFHEGHGWAGRPDLVADLKDRARWLIDYKSGTGVYPETALQVGAYGQATHVQVPGPDGELRDDPFPKVDRYGVLHVRPDTWTLHPLKVDRSTYATFRHLQQAYPWTRVKADTIVGAALPTPKGAVA